MGGMMGNNIHEVLKEFSVEELEKLKVLVSMIPGIGTRNEEARKNGREIVTLRIFAEEYSNYIKQNRSKNYYSSVVYSLNHLTNYFNPQVSIQSISLRDIEEFCTYLQHKVNKGFRVYYRTLKSAFNKAKEWNYLNENYFIKVKLPKKQRVAPGFINSDQLTAISIQIKNTTVRDVVLFAFHTGMRLSEIINLRWKNVDLETRIITVGDDQFITKGRKQRFVPMSDALTSVLSQRERKETPSCILPLKKEGEVFSYVFCRKDGERFTGNYFSKQFKKACTAAGLDSSLHFHSLRHSFASSLVQKGVPLYTIKELLGHSSISTTEIYSHLNMEVLREAVEKLNGRCEMGKVKGEKSDVKSKMGNPTPSVPLPGGEGSLRIFRINGEKV